MLKERQQTNITKKICFIIYHLATIETFGDSLEVAMSAGHFKFQN